MHIHPIFLFILLFKVIYAHEFVGTHYVASYYECNHEALCNLEKLKAAMREGIDQAGATALTYSEYCFEPDGFTLIWVLSESHASIHTYPEYDACFIDFFTCGNQCSTTTFDQVMQVYLNPKKTSAQVLLRK